MKKLTTVLVIGAMVMNTGCASMFNGSTNRIHIRSEVPGAKIYVDEHYIGTQEAVAEIPKKEDPIIRVKKPGCSDGVRPLDKQFDATTLLGVLLDFGLISILLVDLAATGAVQKAKYTSLLINPVCE